MTRPRIGFRARRGRPYRLRRGLRTFLDTTSRPAGLAVLILAAVTLGGFLGALAGLAVLGCLFAGR